MDSYSPLLERIRAPQPSLQRFAVISVFDKIRSDATDSASAGTVISHCFHSNAAAVVDQTVRELCRLVKDRKMRTSEGLLELQAALEGCRDPRFVDVFVKGIGFLCCFEFRNNPAWGFEVAENHPFVKVLFKFKKVPRGEAPKYRLRKKRRMKLLEANAPLPDAVPNGALPKLRLDSVLIKDRL
ncbi:hypothetical protein ACLOJK_019388 [Asimina triloba]